MFDEGTSQFMKEKFLGTFPYIFIIFLVIFLFNGCKTPHKVDINKEITNKSKEAKEYIEPIVNEAKETVEDVVQEVKKEIQSTGQEIQEKLKKLK